MFRGPSFIFGPGFPIQARGGSPTITSMPPEAPEFIVKAVLLFGDEESEGTLVRAVALPWYEIIDWLTKDPQGAYQIDPRRWEEILAGAYERSGQFDEIILTPRSGDKGRDVIASKNGVGAIRIFDQMKAYSPGRTVTAAEVREMFGTISLNHSVSKGVITTTSTFAPRLLDDDGLRAAIPFRLELKPVDVLLPWLAELAGRT
jgi:restriction system protein